MLSCSNRDKPKNLIAEDKMEAILLDMLLTQSYSTYYQGLLSVEQMDSVTQWVFSRHNTDSLTFNSSYNYYIEHPILLDSMLSNISKKVEKIPAVKDTLAPIEQRISTLPPKQRLEQLRKQMPDIIQKPTQ